MAGGPVPIALFSPRPYLERQSSAMRMYRLLLLFLSSVLVLSACNFGAADPTPVPSPVAAAPTATSVPATATNLPTATSVPATATAVPVATATAETPGPAVSAASFAEAECRFRAPTGVNVRCGYLTVPENRADPAGRTIRLHVAIFPSRSANPLPDPVVYLEGGPGGNPLELAPFTFQPWFSDLAVERDVIIFDQRGTGYSEPALDCPEFIDLSYELLDQDLTREEGAARSLEAIEACRDRLEAEGIDLSAYTSAANAADLEDLRLALGYEQWNLYGISYGTRLALTAMRDFPDGIRSAILDSPYPPQVSQADLPGGADRAFDLLFAACANDPDCAAAYPDLEQVFYEMVDRLEAEPVLVPVVNPFTGRMYELLFDGETLVGTLFDLLYQTSEIPFIPALIYAAYQDGDFTQLADAAMLDLYTADFVSYGMYYSVNCADEVSFSTRDELEAANAAFPEQLGAIGSEYVVDFCVAWGAGAAPPIENEPVTSSIPTLIMAGEFDPITPPEYGREAAETLPNSYVFEFPGMGHGVSVDDPCPRVILLAFLNDPTTAPPAACIGEMRGPDFE